MKAFRNYAVTTIILLSLLSVYVPIRYGAPYPKKIGPQFDNRVRQTYINVLNEQRPEVFLLGDSMLGPAVDAEAVERGIHRKVYMISLPGTASTIWYLMIKNNIVVAEHKPKYLVVFFRDTMMTLPWYRVTGRYFEQIDEFATPEDTLLIERAYLNEMNALERFMEAYMPLYSSRWIIRQSIDYHIRNTPGRLLLGCDPSCMNRSLEVVLENQNLDPQFLSDAVDAENVDVYSSEVLNFDEQIDKTFLPEIIRLCKENGIQLILVRMPILVFYPPQEKPRGLDAYIERLAAYLDENDVYYLDFDQGKEMPVEFFEDTLHLNQQGREVFTRELTEALERIIE